MCSPSPGWAAAKATVSAPAMKAEKRMVLEFELDECLMKIKRQTRQRNESVHRLVLGSGSPRREVLRLLAHFNVVLSSCRTLRTFLYSSFFSSEERHLSASTQESPVFSMASPWHRQPRARRAQTKVLRVQCGDECGSLCRHRTQTRNLKPENPQTRRSRCGNRSIKIRSKWRRYA